MTFYDKSRRARYYEDSLSYDEVVQDTVREAKRKIRGCYRPNYDKLLEKEKEGKDRKTLKEFIKNRKKSEETGGETSDQRHRFQSDRDRVLHSLGFRKLSGVTQVAASQEVYRFHNRLTHSMKVAQIGERFSEYIDRNNDVDLNSDVVETACLAHDIGHPPFGHIAEEEINRKMEQNCSNKGFEGNAQSFRVITRLSPHRSNNKIEDKGESNKGLDLTRASLNATMKYPWQKSNNGNNALGYDESEKWGYYDEDSDVAKWVRNETEGKKRVLEACIMDWADDVAYAVHDVIDFYKAGFIPLDRILGGPVDENAPEKKEDLNEVTKKFYETVDDVDLDEFLEVIIHFRTMADESLHTPFEGSRDQRIALDSFASALIQKYVMLEDDQYRINSDADRVFKVTDTTLKSEIDVLHSMTNHFVINSSELQSQQRGQRQIVADLFDIFLDAIEDDDKLNKNTVSSEDIIPSRFKHRVERVRKGDIGTRCRLVADIISGLTEKEAVNLHEVFHDPGSHSVQESLN